MKSQFDALETELETDKGNLIDANLAVQTARDAVKAALKAGGFPEGASGDHNVVSDRTELGMKYADHEVAKNAYLVKHEQHRRLSSNIASLV